MTQTIQNGINSLENLFAVNTFQIPQYQRAYSWEEDPHLEAFLDDLRQQVSTQEKYPEKHYFLGTLLLHEEDVGAGHKVVNIVDGQQRMTTSVVFIATALALHTSGKIEFTNEKPALLRRNFVHDEVTESQKFHTIQEDDPFFQSAVLRISKATCEHDSPSSYRLKSAADYFAKQVKPGEWEALIYALKTAKVMVYAVDSAEDATQIFELQNDRGKSLTSLEALKSFLMHCVYLHSNVRADDRLAALQTQFAKIFRKIEALSEWKRTPGEDQLLANHCAAFLKWTEKEYNNPKHLVKATIKVMKVEEVIPWIEDFVNSLLKSYETIEDIFSKRDSLPEFSELLLLNRMGSYWPLILKTWRCDKSSEKRDFRKVCRLLEVYTFRGFAVANLRADTNLSFFLTMAKDFSIDFSTIDTPVARNGERSSTSLQTAITTDAFAKLFKDLSKMSHWNNIENRFMDGLKNANFYHDEGSDAHYFLWRYENHLRGQPGQQQPLLSWRDFVEPISYAAKFSVEHIAAQDNPIASTDVAWIEGDESRPFHEVALNRLGNLVIDSISPNASKGKKDFIGKQKSLSEKSIYLSQGELVNFLSNSEVPVWDVEAIRSRQAHLIKFASETWDTTTWHATKNLT